MSPAASAPGETVACRRLRRRHTVRASHAPRFAGVEPAPLPIPLPRFPRPTRPRCPDILMNPVDVTDYPATTAATSPSHGTFMAGSSRTESIRFTKRANMCADHARTLDACGVATPYRRKLGLVPTATVLARAQSTYRSRFRGAYATHRSGAMPPCRPSTAKSSASLTDPHDAHDSVTVRGLERADPRVVPVSPTPPMAAEKTTNLLISLKYFAFSRAKIHWM